MRPDMMDPVELGKLLQQVQHQQETMGRLASEIDKLIKTIEPLSQQVGRNSIFLRLLGGGFILIFPVIIAWNNSLRVELNTLNRITTIIETKLQNAAPNSSP